MKIKIYKKFNEMAASENLANNIPIFATQQYADMLRITKNYKTSWIEWLSDSNIHYFIPFSVKKKGLLKKGMFLTAIISLGNIDEVEYQKQFLNKLISIIKKKRLCDLIQQPPNWAIFNTYPLDSIYVPFGTYRIDLSSNKIDDLFNSIQKRTKQYINKAIREKITIVKERKSIDNAFKLIKKIAKNANIWFPNKKELNSIINNLKENFWVYVAYDEKSMLQSYLILFSSKYSTYTYLAGSVKEVHPGAGALLHWEAIKDSKIKNVKYFDFVGARINPEPGSKQERIQRFKEHFSVELYKGYLWKMPISKTKYSIYVLALKCYNILRGKKYNGDIIDQEMKKLDL